MITSFINEFEINTYDSMISTHDFKIIPNSLGSFCTIDGYIPVRSEFPYQLEFNNKLFFDPFGQPVTVKRLYLKIEGNGSDLTLFDIQLGHFSLNLSFISSYHLLFEEDGSPLLSTFIYGNRSRFQGYHRYKIKYVMSLPKVTTEEKIIVQSSSYVFSLLQCLEQIDSLVAQLLDDLFSNSSSQSPSKFASSLLTEFYYKKHVDLFLEKFYSYYSI
ncbi:MAG: hypothetical protein ACTSYA_08145 [Candidatus Kariarchaeaceae archaeon]